MKFYPIKRILIKNMYWVFCFTFFFNYCLFSHSLEPKSLLVSQKITLEDFEKINLSTSNIKFNGNSISLPEIKMTSFLISPELQSDRAMLVRILPENYSLPFTIQFSNNYIIEDQLISIEFHIYSNYSRTQIFLILKDSDGNFQKLSITNLTFVGWKKINLQIPNFVNQENYSLWIKRPIEIVGILFNPNSKIKKDKEDFIVIDDIIAYTRSKNLIPQKKLIMDYKYE